MTKKKYRENMQQVQRKEIERKWIVDASLMPNFDTFSHQELRQVYTPEGRFREVKNKHGVHYNKTIKKGNGIERIEIEEAVSHDIFASVWSNVEYPRITKTRIEIPFRKYIVELDQFHGNGSSVDGHIVAEIEFATRRAADAFANDLERNKIMFHGQNIKNWLIRDVSEVDGYSNIDFATHGWPTS